MKKNIFFIIFFIFTINLYADNIENLFEDSGEEDFFKVEEQIIVSASKREQKLKDAPVSISVITDKDIEMSGAQSIAEVLRMVPGVYVQETTGGQIDVSIRGLINGPKEAGPFSVFARSILVLINGRSYFNDIFGGVFWNFLPITTYDIKRIEVVRGPASPLFGPNAVGGVINIITKDPKKTEKNIFSFAAGDRGQAQGKLRINKQYDNLSFSFSTEYNHKDRFDNMSYNASYDKFEPDRHSILASPPDYSPNPDYPANKKTSLGNYALSLFMKYDFKEKNNLELQIGRTKGSANIPGTSGDLLLVNYDKMVNNTIKLIYNINKWKLSFSNVWGGFGDEYTSNDMADGNEQDGINWNSYDLDIQKILSFDKDILVLGVNWRESMSEGGDVFFRDNLEKKQKFQSVFFNNEHSFTNNFKIILGTRYDKFDAPDNGYYSPQAILFYRLKNDDTVRLIYSKAMQVPFISDLFANAQFSAGEITAGTDIGKLAPIITIYGDRNLEPMTIKSYELSYSTIFKKVNFDMSLYHYDVKDVLGYNANINNDTTYISTGNPTDLNTCSALDIKSVNLDGTLKSNGLELSFNYKPTSNFKIWGNYTYQDSRFQGHHTNNVPSHLASIGGYKSFSKGWTVSASLNYVSSSEVSVTNIMDQSLANINKDLQNNPSNWLIEALGSDAYKAEYKRVGGIAYTNLTGGAGVLNEATAAFMGYDTSIWHIPGYSNAEATFFTILGNDNVSNDTNLEAAALGATRSANGSIYQMSATKITSLKVNDYLFLNLKIAKKIFKGNGEVSFIASIRPSIRMYAFGEKTGSKFRTEITYKF